MAVAAQKAHIDPHYDVV